MSVNDQQGLAPVGRLTGLERGVLTGELPLDSALRGHGSLTIEAFAHGIRTASALVPVQGAEGDLLAFRLPITGFPQVTLPCTLTARIVETDTVLDSAMTIETLEQLWQQIMPFTARVEKLTYNRVVVRVTGLKSAPADQIFELRNWGDPVAISELDAELADGTALYVIALPERLLDGGEHRLSVVHRGSGLPLSAQPIHLRFDLRSDPQPVLREVLDRVTDIERQLRERYAEAFNGLAAELYRHIDTVTQNQRANFEREIAAMRKLLGLQEQPATATAAAPLPATVTIPFEGKVNGYGIYATELTTTGKAFRFVSPICGFLLPAIQAEKPRLRVQGIRRLHDAALDGAKLFVNGTPVDCLPYINRASESWNITANVPPALLRTDRNMIELRLPKAVPEQLRLTDRGDHGVGVMYVTLGDPELLAGA